ncbi:MAG: M23 family metallopeptidase [Bacteroidales bacterium]|nr:M23 family metallopeptidase [Bacteroidales bacterium]
MAKNKFKYNPETVSYDLVDHSFGKKLLRLLPHFISVLFTSTIIVFLFFFFIDSPKEKALKRQNQEIIANYQFLNKELDEINDVLKEMKYRDENIYRTIFEAEPISDEIRKAGFGGSDNYTDLRRLDPNQIVAKTVERFDILSKQLYVQSISFDEVAELAKNKEKMVSSVPSIMPIALDELTRISSPFGRRIDPVYGTWKMHEGMDFTAKTGTPIHVTGDGVVVEIERSIRGYGNNIIIDHGFGYKTRYAHLHTIGVVEGQKVKRGEVIGTVGNTGKSVGPHLHYEVHKKNVPIDPINFYFEDITPEQYNEMILQSTQPGGQSLD